MGGREYVPVVLIGRTDGTFMTLQEIKVAAVEMVVECFGGRENGGVKKAAAAMRASRKTIYNLLDQAEFGKRF